LNHQRSKSDVGTVVFLVFLKTINITADQRHFFDVTRNVFAQNSKTLRRFSKIPTGQKWETLTLAIVHGTVLFR